MKDLKKFYAIALLAIFFTSFLSAILLFLYMDIERNFTVGYSVMGAAVFLALSSFLAMSLYFFKKILYRGDTYLVTLQNSIRQGVIIGIYLMGNIALYAFSILTAQTAFLAFSVTFFTELLFQSMEEG